jgi:hypothetical protein
MNDKKTVIRPDPQTGEPDDTVVACDWIHLERMDDHWWWLGVYRGDLRITFHLTAEDNVAKIEVIEDELGAIDDTKDNKVDGGG